MYVFFSVRLQLTKLHTLASASIAPARDTRHHYRAEIAAPSSLRNPCPYANTRVYSLSPRHLRRIRLLRLVIAAHILLHVAVAAVSVFAALPNRASLAHAAYERTSTSASSALMKLAELSSFCRHREAVLGAKVAICTVAAPDRRRVGGTAMRR